VSDYCVQMEIAPQVVTWTVVPSTVQLCARQAPPSPQSEPTAHDCSGAGQVAWHVVEGTPLSIPTMQHISPLQSFGAWQP
jgi:hypothetical protein